ncbi:MAG: hypothetical protein ACFFCS_09965 [Candidatus Hodarchaeota archaeon]
MKKKAKKKETHIKRVGGIYKLVNMSHRFKLYKLFKHVPLPIISFFAHLLYKLFFSRNRKVKHWVRRSLVGFSGKRYPRKFLDKLVDASIVNLAMLLVDLMLKAPNYTPTTYHKAGHLEGLDLLDEKLAEGRGVLIPSVHVGEFFHCIGGLLLAGYNLAVVGNMKNRVVFENVVKFPQYSKMRVIAMDQFNNVRDEMFESLEENRILFLMHDMPRNSRLKTPFIHGEREYLVSTPQSIITLHRKTGAPILPMVAEPNGHFLKSRIFFLDPSGIEAASARYKDADAKTFHGEVCTEINKALFSHALRYLHGWEELISVWTSIGKINIQLPAGSTLLQIVDEMESWIQSLLEGSYEPGRDDAGLIAWLETGWIEIRKMLDAEPEGKRTLESGVLERKGVISLGALGTSNQLQKILGVLASIARRAGYTGASKYIATRMEQVSSFFVE